MRNNNFHQKLKIKMDAYVQYVYLLTKKFPKDELYGVTSQLRRAAVSVILNYIEGFARIKPKVKLNSFEISYGSLKETKYLSYLSYKQNYITQEEYKKALTMNDEIGAMLWKTIVGQEKKCN